MNKEDRLLVTDEPVEFEKRQVEVQDFRWKKKYRSFEKNLWNILPISQENFEDHNM